MPVNSTARGLDWEKATTDEKLEFLYHWSEMLEDGLIRRGQEIHALHQRLEKIEQRLPGNA
jgi:hypothetical protein